MKIKRFDALDALRGGSMVWMTVFHFCFDLNHFGYTQQNFLIDPVWTWQRTIILSLFLFTAGVGQAVAVQQGQTWARFWQRWRWVAGSAVLVSVGSYLMYPRTFIYFGVLHGMAVMVILVRFTAGWGAWLWLLGLLAIATKYIAESVLLMGTSADLFNSMGFNWLGLVTAKPVTEDYVPLIPWLGVMWWGMAAGAWAVRNRTHWLTLDLSPMGRALSVLGRHSLGYYLVHQPVMIGAIMAFRFLQMRAL
jgi:uncharacterized membrane protein